MIRVTQRQIASRLGLSQQAVAFALSDNPACHRQVHPKTRTRILETARRIGYVPHHAARRLARARSDNHTTNFDQVGLIHLTRPDAKDSFVDPVCLAMMQGAEYELSQLHASLTFIRVRDSQDWQKIERLTLAGGVDGWLVYGPPNDDMANRLRSTHLPFVVLGDRRCTQPVHSVNIDNLAVGRLAAEHLASLGHRRIAYMAGRMTFVFQEQIWEGFRAAVRDLGLDDDKRLFIDISNWKYPGIQQPIDWLQNLDPMPTAVFMPDIGVAQTLQPIFRLSQSAALKKISVLSCGASPPDGMGQEFTRIDLPMNEVGRQGALLIHRLVSESSVDFFDEKISPSLGEGGSTRHPNNQGRTENAQSPDKRTTN